MLKKLLIVLSFILSLTAVTVFAEEEGYIFQLEEGVILPLSAADGVERISSEKPVYSAETLENVYDFVSESAIKYIGRDARVYLYGTESENTGETLETVPNDPYYKSYQWNLQIVNMTWDEGLRGEGTTVCVIDSGIYKDHSDFDSGKITASYNVLDKNRDVSDNVSHGTFVAGIIGAETSNAKGIAGAADKAQMVIIKTFENKRETHISDIIAALEKANTYDVDVVNMSLGTTEALEDDTKKMFYDAVDRLVKKGVIVIAAAGNEGNETLSYPAAFDNVIGVGAVAKNKERCYFSEINNSVFVVAPGGVKNSGDSDSVVYSLSNKNPNGIAGSEGGTSFAAPHVAAAAAIAKGIYPQLTSEQFKKILIDTSEDLGETGYDTSYGYGLIDVEKAVAEVKALANGTSSGAETKSTTEPTTEPATEPHPEFTAEPTAEPIPEFTFNPENYRTLSYDSESGNVTVETSDKDAVVYIADFKDGALVSLKTVKLSELTDDNGMYVIPFADGTEPTKLFLWHGMQSCIAAWTNENYLLPTFSPEVTDTPEATVEPTVEPTSEPIEVPREA